MFQSSLDEVIHEIDDLDQEPGEDEIREYAELIGIDPDNERDLLWIARAGITAALPPDWKPIQVNNGDELYFYNFKTGESSWEHPSDDKYRKMVLDERAKKSQHKHKNGTSGGASSKTADAKTAVKPLLTASNPTASTDTAPLRPLTQPPPIGSVGKLAPIGGQKANLTPNRPGKLEPINSATGPSSFGSKPVPNSVGPIKQVGGDLERPKTSRGPASNSTPQPTTLGGGARFLKKPDEDTVSSKGGREDRISVQNVMQFPPEESESESSSSSSSESQSAANAAARKEGTTQKPLSSVDKPKAADSKITTVASPSTSKPPVAPKATSLIRPMKTEETVPAIQPMSSSAAPAGTPEKPKVASSSPAGNEPQNKKDLSETPAENIETLQKQLQEEYERRVKQLREQHDAKMKDVKSKFEEEEKKEVEKLKRAMEARLRTLNEKLQKDEDNEMQSLTSSHKKQMSDMRSKLEQERIATEKRLRSASQEAEEERRRTVVNGNRPGHADVTAENVRLEKEHEEAVSSMRTRLEKELAKERERHEMERKQKMAELGERLQRELDEWYQRERERKMALLKNDLDKELGEIRSRLATEQRSALELETSNDIDLRRRELGEWRERRLDETRREHETDLNKIKLRDKATVANDTVLAACSRETEQIRRDTFDDLTQRQEEAFKTAELQMKAFREELSNLTRMAVDIRETLLPGSSNNADGVIPAVSMEGRNYAAPKEKRKVHSQKADVVRSIEDLLSLDVAGGDRSSRVASSTEEKLLKLASDDVTDKVSRFLDSQKGVHAPSRYANQTSPSAEPERSPLLNGMADAIGADVNVVQLTEAPPMRPTQRYQNIFRVGSKDAVDEFLDQKVKEYFRGGVSSVQQRSPLWLPSTAFSYHERYYNKWRNGQDVESELNSLKRWLREFESRLVNGSGGNSSVAPKRLGRNGLLPIEHVAKDHPSSANRIGSLSNEEAIDV